MACICKDGKPTVGAMIIGCANRSIYEEILADTGRCSVAWSKLCSADTLLKDFLH